LTWRASALAALVAFLMLAWPTQLIASLSDNLVACWPLDEASGNATDAVGSSTLTSNGSVGATTGKVGTGSRTFNGSSQYLNAASSATLQTGAIDFSVA